MLFSIVCPSYNVENFISECIESVLNQSFVDWELIIVDDGSKDNTKNVVSRFLKDKRISLFSIPHSGQTITRNYGVDKAKGDYIVFLDSDDCLHKDTLINLFRSIQKEPFDILSYNMKYFNSIKDIVNDNISDLSFTTYKGSDILKYYYGKNKTMSLCGNAIKRNLVVKGFESVPETLRTIRFCEDFVTIFEIIKLCSSSIVFKAPFYYYRVNPDSVSHTKKPEDRTELTAAYEHVYSSYFQIEKSDKDIIETTKVFLSYLPITLVINASKHKRKVFLASRKMVLFSLFTLKNHWDSLLLKIIVFAMKHRLFILCLVFDKIYAKKYRINCKS